MDSASSPSPSFSTSPPPPIPEPPGDSIVLFPGSPSIAAALLGASRPNPFGGYPINMSKKELEMVHHSELLELFTSIATIRYQKTHFVVKLVWASGQVAFQPFRSYWFSLGMLDPAAMHLVIANAAMHLKSLRRTPNGDDNIVELTHVEAAITSVNQRIRDFNQNVTDEMLGAILGVCQSMRKRILIILTFHS